MFQRAFRNPDQMGGISNYLTFFASVCNAALDSFQWQCIFADRVVLRRLSDSQNDRRGRKRLHPTPIFHNLKLSSSLHPCDGLVIRQVRPDADAVSFRLAQGRASRFEWEIYTCFAAD